MAVAQEAYSYDELLRAWKELAKKQSFSLQEIPGPGERALMHAEIGVPGKPVISFTSGMHGDEPAAP